jgi:hypothetical protein
MDASEMVRQLKVKQQSIRDLLPRLQRELALIDKTIRDFEDLVSKGYTLDVEVPPELAHLVNELPSGATTKETRVPLAQRRAALLNFLMAHGPATRAQIVAATGIPAGSLSALLAEDEFASTQYGTWHVKGTPGNSEEDD